MDNWEKQEAVIKGHDYVKEQDCLWYHTSYVWKDRFELPIGIRSCHSFVGTKEEQAKWKEEMEKKLLEKDKRLEWLLSHWEIKNLREIENPNDLSALYHITFRWKAQEMVPDHLEPYYEKIGTRNEIKLWMKELESLFFEGEEPMLFDGNIWKHIKEIVVEKTLH